MHNSSPLVARIGVTYRRCDPRTSNSPEIRLYVDWWNAARGERIAPAWAEFDWSIVPSAIIPHMGVVDVRRDPVDFVYRFWGSAHVTAHNQELTGRSVRDMRPSEEADSVFTQYRETLLAREPRLYVNTIRVSGASTALTETSLRLPFSNDGVEVHQILAFSDIRESHAGVRQLFEELAKLNPLAR